MKKFWKALGLAALATAAANIPVRVKKDGEKRGKTYQSLLYTMDIRPGEGGDGADVTVNFGEGILTGAITGLVTAKKEAELFADDDPDAAVLEAEELQLIADEAQEAADEAQAIADEAQEAADEAQAIADEAQAAADEAAEAAEAAETGDDDTTGSEF